jgi:catechol 2,3-dioxygenase-like lactoylglutathione lyase family enzyme
MSDRFHHLSIAPADWPATVAFYADTLRWSVTETWGGKGEPRGTILSGGGVKVVIVEDDRAAGAGPSRPRLHLDIHDIDARFKTIPQGAHVVTPPQDTTWGTRWFVLQDPDGNLIAFEEVGRNGS